MLLMMMMMMICILHHDRGEEERLMVITHVVWCMVCEGSYGGCVGTCIELDRYE
jgi:hypothetical protein